MRTLPLRGVYFLRIENFSARFSEGWQRLAKVFPALKMRKRRPEFFQHHEKILSFLETTLLTISDYKVGKIP